MRTRHRATGLFAAFLVGLAHPILAGPNAAFTLSIDAPRRIDNPEVGQTVSLVVRAAGTSEVKNTKVRLLFDPAIVEFSGYTSGDLIPGAQSFPDAQANPSREDGLAEAGYGSALLGTGLTNVTTGGVIGTFRFKVVGPVPDAGSGIWVLLAEIGLSGSAEDVDVLNYTQGQLGVSLVRRYANRVFNLNITRAYDGGTFAWESRFPGLADTVRVRASGDSLWQTVASDRAADFGADLVTGARALLAAGLVMDDSSAATVDATLADAGLEPPFSAGFLDSLAVLDQLLLSRRHVVTFTGLSADTQYDYQVRSSDLDERVSDRLTGAFRTRLAPDLRPAVGSDLDVQSTRTTVSATWFTNRPADTRLRITDSLGTEVGVITLDPQGDLVHAASLAGLAPDTRYSYRATSRLVGIDNLIQQGLLTEAQATVIDTGTFRTRKVGVPLRLLTPPSRVVSPESAVIQIQLNQLAIATVAYGELDDEAPVPLYTESVRSGDILTSHSLTLSDLVPATRYRYRVTAVTPDGDSLSTDPRGNQQWSRDLSFTTSAAGDTLPPVIVEGPAVTARDVIGVVRFVTDVDTRATVFFGTRGGTYGTADEFEIADRTADGSLRLSQEHAITIAGLQPGQAYDYGIVVEATNGQVASFEPNLPVGKPARAGKRLAILQPPGGAGSFTTSNDPDTQYPVILTGPTVASKTHQTAIIEWTTDEPATSQIEFGVEAIGEARQSSGVGRTRHKMVLTNLEAGAAYTYQVASTDISGNGATTSGEALFTTNPEVDLTAPQIVDAPAVTYRTNEAATIRWTTDEDATAQIAFGIGADNLDFIRTAAATGRSHSITLTNLEAATTYYYVASSSDLSNNGPTESDTLSFVTDATADTTAPVLSDIEVAAADSSAIVVWTSDEVADSFVDVGTVSGILDVTVGDTEDLTDHEVVLTNLTPGQTYYFTVGSSDRSGNGPTVSQELSFTTLDSADTTPPATPADLTATPGSQQAVLSWTANTELDLAGYNLYRRSGDDAFALVASRLTRPSYADQGLTNDVTYEYRVTAIDRARPANESAPTTAVSLTPTLSAAPTAPTDLSVGGLDLQPTFTFVNAEPFTTGGVLTYTVQVSTQPDFSDVAASKSGIPGGTGTTSWTIDRTLGDRATYYWRARAVEGFLTGPFSEAQEFYATAGPLIAGDFDESGVVDLVDFFLFADAYNKSAADFPYYDLDLSGPGTTIDLVDFFVFADAYGTGAGKEAGLASVEAPVDDALALHLTVSGGPLGAADLPRDVVRLRVDAEQARTLSAWGLVLTWDPAALTFTDAERHAGGLLAAGDGDAGLFHVLTQRPGRLVLADARGGGAVSGDGELARLRFRVRDRSLVSNTALRVEEALVSGGQGDIRRVATVAPARLRPGVFSLGAAYPNPFNPSTSIDFALPTATTARLTVYDVLGRPVRTLLRADEPLAAGFYAVTWNGRDDAGRSAGSGLYFYRLSTPAATRSGKMMLLK